MRRVLSIVLLTGSVLLCANSGGATGGEMEEYRVKALFLYNFTQFVEWPEGAFRSGTDPLTICIVAPSPFDRGEIEQVLAGKRIDNHPLRSRVIEDPHQAAGCQIVFISSFAERRVRGWLSGHKPPGLLTVGENPGFASSGGVVNFRLLNGHVRLEINAAAAEREGLRVSAKLLKLAEIVQQP